MDDQVQEPRPTISMETEYLVAEMKEWWKTQYENQMNTTIMDGPKTNEVASNTAISISYDQWYILQDEVTKLQHDLQEHKNRTEERIDRLLSLRGS